MRRGARVIEIYRELRDVIGGTATAAELLTSAESLVALFEVEEGVPGHQWRLGHTPFEMQELDVAIADGGWRMLRREWNWMGLEADDGCGGRPAQLHL